MTVHPHVAVSKSAPTLPEAFSQSTFRKSSLAESSDARDAMRSNGLNDRTVSGHRRENSSSPSIRDAKTENQDWLAAQMAKRSVIEVRDRTGMTDKAVQNIRQRKSKISFDNLVEMCRNDEQFRVEFFRHCGGILEGEPGMVAALSRAINAIVRQRGST